MPTRDVNLCAELFAKFILEMYQIEGEEERLLRIEKAKKRMNDWCNNNGYNEGANKRLITGLTWLTSPEKHRHIIKSENETKETSGWLQNMSFLFMAIPDACHAWFDNTIIEARIAEYLKKLNN